MAPPTHYCIYNNEVGAPTVTSEYLVLQKYCYQYSANGWPLTTASESKIALRNGVRTFLPRLGRERLLNVPRWIIADLPEKSSFLNQVYFELFWLFWIFLNLPHYFFYIFELIYTIIIHRMSVSDKATSFVPIAKCKRAHAKHCCNLLDCKIFWFHR